MNDTERQLWLELVYAETRMAGVIRHIRDKAVGVPEAGLTEPAEGVSVVTPGGHEAREDGEYHS